MITITKPMTMNLHYDREEAYVVIADVVDFHLREFTVIDAPLATTTMMITREVLP